MLGLYHAAHTDQEHSDSQVNAVCVAALSWLAHLLGLHHAALTDQEQKHSQVSAVCVAALALSWLTHLLGLHHAAHVDQEQEHRDSQVNAGEHVPCHLCSTEQSLLMMTVVVMVQQTGSTIRGGEQHCSLTRCTSPSQARGLQQCSTHSKSDDPLDFQSTQKADKARASRS